MVRAAYVDKNGVKRGAWSEEEDHKLRAYVLRYGHWNWRLVPKYAGLQRCGKSCRLRWMNYLKPGVKRGNYTKEEEDLIAKLRHELGNKWSAIAEKLPGRTDNDIKNYWHTHLKKCSKTSKLERQQQQQQQQQEAEIFHEENSSEIVHHKNFEEKPEVSSDVLYILDSSSRSNSVVPRTVNLGLEQNFSGMLSGSSNSLSFNWEVNDDCASSSDLFPGFHDSFWPDPFMVDAPSTQDFDFTQLDDGGLFSTPFPTFDSYDAINLFQQ